MKRFILALALVWACSPVLFAGQSRSRPHHPGPRHGNSARSPDRRRSEPRHRAAPRERIAPNPPGAQQRHPAPDRRYDAYRYKRDGARYHGRQRFPRRYPDSRYFPFGRYRGFRFGPHIRYRYNYGWFYWPWYSGPSLGCGWFWVPTTRYPAQDEFEDEYWEYDDWHWVYICIN